MEHALRIPVSPRPARDEAVDARTLGAMTRTELDALFAGMAATDAASLRGRYHGALCGVIGIDRLPARLRELVYAVLRTPLNVWRGKSFDGDHGANRWGVGEGQLAFAAYRLEPGMAHDGTGPCLLLDYDVPENLLPLRAILGEIRQLGPGLHLGRMTWRAGQSVGCALYFTLEG
ncbi:MAG: hypothetical protein KIT14_03480 [bacterium]|nr:hypothetical protein [bacterium]